jgi:hypothetical protein
MLQRHADHYRAGGAAEVAEGVHRAADHTRMPAADLQAHGAGRRGGGPPGPSSWNGRSRSMFSPAPTVAAGCGLWRRSKSERWSRRSSGTSSCPSLSPARRRHACLDIYPASSPLIGLPTDWQSGAAVRPAASSRRVG